VGDVVPEPIKEGDSHYVARVGGISPARDRSVADADRAIRVELRRQKFLEAEKQFEAELRKKYPVVIDEAAIESYRAPEPAAPKAAPAPAAPKTPEPPAPKAP
jgi:hypothetical protein